MSRRTRTRASGDGGFTLPEMMVAIAILGIVIVPITAVIFVGLKTTASTTTRLNESHDRQLVEVYFPRDSSSASSAQINATSTSCFLGGPSLVLFKWTAVAVSGAPVPTTVPQSFEADYVVQGGKLIRWLCDGTTKAQLTVAYSLAAANPVTPTLPSAKSAKLRITDASGATYEISGGQRS